MCIHKPTVGHKVGQVAEIPEALAAEVETTLEAMRLTLELLARLAAVAAEDRQLLGQEALVETDMSKSSTKLFAIVRDGIVSDGWLAESIEEAQEDNPGATVIEVTLENSPWEWNRKVEINNA
jgi:hypothetical protein